VSYVTESNVDQCKSDTRTECEWRQVIQAESCLPKCLWWKPGIYYLINVWFWCNTLTVVHFDSHLLFCDSANNFLVVLSYSEVKSSPCMWENFLGIFDKNTQHVMLFATQIFFSRKVEICKNVIKIFFSPHQTKWCITQEPLTYI